MSEAEKKTVTIEITFDLEDPQGGDGHFILTPKGIPKPMPFGTLMKWSKEQQDCLEPSIVKKPQGHWDMPEVSRAVSIFRGLLATTIHLGEIQIPDTTDWEGWVRVLEYWKTLVQRKMKNKKPMSHEKIESEAKGITLTLQADDGAEFYEGQSHLDGSTHLLAYAMTFGLENRSKYGALLVQDGKHAPDPKLLHLCNFFIYRVLNYAMQGNEIPKSTNRQGLLALLKYWKNLIQRKMK